MMTFVIVVLVAVAVLAAYLTRPGSAARTTRGPFEGAHERDPVCGMNVDVSHAAGRREHGGRIFWFCSVGCEDKFDADPERYSSKGLAAAMP